MRGKKTRSRPGLFIMGACLVARMSTATEATSSPASTATSSNGVTQSTSNAPIAPLPTTQRAEDAMPSADSDPSVDRAREAFVLGANLARQGEWPEALRAFERAYELHAHPAIMYNIGYCERALGHYTRAYKAFRASLSQHEAGTTGTLPAEQLALTKAYLVEVDKRLVRVRVHISDPSSRLAVDGRPLEVVSSASAPRLTLIAGTRDDRGVEPVPGAVFDLIIDPGRHLFVLSRASAPEIVRTETFESGTTTELTLDAPVANKRRADATNAVPKTGPAAQGDSRTTWMWIAYGTGGAGLVLASIFGSLAWSKANYLSSKCGSDKKNCDLALQPDIDAGNTFATIADVGAGVAVAGAAVGTYLLLSRPHTPRDARSSATTIVPLIGPAALGAKIQF